MEYLPVPTLILRAAFRENRTQLLEEHSCSIAVCGKVLGRTSKRAILSDSFGCIEVCLPREEQVAQIDASIRENYPVKILCRIVKRPGAGLAAVSVCRVGIEEEMFRTVESMHLWNFLLRKQPK